jgi:electron transfer flavoprotein beta subunit
VPKKRFQNKERDSIMIHFYVCLKQVPDVYAPLQIKDGELIQDSGRMVLNAYDASALEEALVLTEKHGGKVTAVLAGPEKAKETLRKGLAMGADEGVHIVTEEGSAYDSLYYAGLLAAFFRDKEYHFISCGKQSQDTDAGLTGSMLAQLLELPYATNAVGLTLEGDRLLVKRQGDHGQEMIELPSPGLVTCSNDMNEPRIPSLKGIMQSKKKPVETIQASSLTGDGIRSVTTLLGYEEKPKREPGQKFEGDPEELAITIAGLLDSKENLM